MPGINLLEESEKVALESLADFFGCGGKDTGRERNRVKDMHREGKEGIV